MVKQLKRKIFSGISILFLIMVAFIGCQKRCKKTAKAFSKQPAYQYYVFKPTEWLMTNSSDTLDIKYGPYNFAISNCNELNFPLLFYIAKGTDFTLGETEITLSESVDFNKKNSEVSIHVGQRLNDFMYSNKSTFNLSNTTPTSDSVQLYFNSQMSVNGENYSDVAVSYFDLSDTTLHVKKLFMAPGVGPIRVIMSDGQTYDLDSTNATIAPYDYYYEVKPL